MQAKFNVRDSLDCTNGVQMFFDIFLNLKKESRMILASFVPAFLFSQTYLCQYANAMTVRDSFLRAANSESHLVFPEVPTRNKVPAACPVQYQLSLMLYIVI